MEVVTKKVALLKGLKFYFTGKPCKYGHITKRDISGNCVDCRQGQRFKELKQKQSRRQSVLNSLIETTVNEWRLFNTNIKHWMEIWPEHVRADGGIKTSAQLSTRAEIYDYRLKHITANGVKRVGEFKGAGVATEFECSCGRVWIVEPYHAVNGVQCKHCGGEKVSRARSIYSDDELLAIGKQYNYSSEFLRANPRAWDMCYSRRLLDKLNFKAKDNGFYHCEYVIRNERLNVAYVGITAQEFDLRMNNHKSENNRTTSRQIVFEKDTVFEKVSGYIWTAEDIDKNGDIKAEHRLYDRYANKGYTLLNDVKRLGDIGVCKAKYTRESCVVLISKYKYLKSFREENGSAFVIIHRKGWADLLEPLIKSTRKDKWNTSKHPLDWLRAAEVYDTWIANGKIGVYKLSKLTAIKQSRLATMLLAFRDSWVPEEDPEWLEWSSNFTVRNKAHTG